MLSFLRDSGKAPLTRQGPVPRKKDEGKDDTVPGFPTQSSILNHYSVERRTVANTSGVLSASGSSVGLGGGPPTAPTAESIALAVAESEAARRAAVQPKSKAEKYLQAALKQQSHYVLSSPAALANGSAALTLEQQIAADILEEELRVEREEMLQRELAIASEQYDIYYAHLRAQIEHEEKTERNNHFVESRAMVLMIMREWRNLLERYKARHPERFHNEAGYLKPNRFWLVRNGEEGEGEVGGDGDTNNRPATALAAAGVSRAGTAASSSKRIFFEDEGKSILSASADAAKIIASNGGVPTRPYLYPLSSANLGASPSSTDADNGRIGSAVSQRSVQVDATTGRVGLSDYDAASSPYRAPAGLRDRQPYNFKQQVPNGYETFTPYTANREFDLKRYLASPDAFDPRKLGEKKVVVLGGDGSVVATTLTEKDLLIVDDEEGGTTTEALADKKGKLDLSASPLAPAIDNSILSLSRPPPPKDETTEEEKNRRTVSSVIASSPQILRTMTRDGGVVVIAPPVGGYTNDAVPIYDNSDAENNDSDKEDYDLDDAELLRRNMLYGDKAARAARKQADWELYELKSREMRRKLQEEEDAKIAAEVAAQRALDEQEEIDAEERARYEAELALLTEPLRTQRPPQSRKERAEMMAMNISAPKDRPGYKGSVPSDSNRPLSGNPAVALSRLRIPSRKYYARVAKRERRAAEEWLFAEMEDLVSLEAEENLAIRTMESAQRRVFEALALEHECLTQERIRQMEWDRYLGSQQNVIVSEEMFLRATFWQEERATRYNLYHWFDDNFEFEVEKIRLRMVRDNTELDRKMAHRKDLEDAAIEKEYARISKRNQSIANEQNQKVILLRRNRLERERFLNAEYADRMFIIREEVDAFHSPLFRFTADAIAKNPNADPAIIEELTSPYQPLPAGFDSADLTQSIDGLRIGIMWPHALEAVVEEYRLLKAQLTKDLSRAAPYDIAKAVGEGRSKAFDAAEAEAERQSRVSSAKYHQHPTEGGGDEWQHSEGTNGKRYIDRVNLADVQPPNAAAPPQIAVDRCADGDGDATDEVTAPIDSETASKAPPVGATAAPTPRGSQGGASTASGAIVVVAPSTEAVVVAEVDHSIIKPHVPFTGREEPSAAEKAAALDKANYQQFMQMVDAEKVLNIAAKPLPTPREEDVVAAVVPATDDAATAAAAADESNAPIPPKEGEGEVEEKVVIDSVVAAPPTAEAEAVDVAPADEEAAPKVEDASDAVTHQIAAAEEAEANEAVEGDAQIATKEVVAAPAVVAAVAPEVKKPSPTQHDEEEEGEEDDE